MIRNEVFSKFRFANMNLHARLISFFVMITIVPILLIGYISYQISSSVIKDIAKQSSTEMIMRSNDEMNKLFDDTYKIAMIVANDPAIQQTLRIPLDTTIEQRYATDLEMDTRLNFSMSYRPEYFGLYVIGENGGKYKSNYPSVRSEDLRTTEWYRKTIQSDRPVWFGAHTDSFVVETAGESFVSVGFPIIDKATGGKIGIVFMDIEESVLKKSLLSNLVKKGFMFINDGGSHIISHAQQKAIPEPIRRMDFAATKDKQYREMTVKDFEGKSFIVIYQTSNPTGWNIGGVISVNELTKESRMIGFVMVAMLIIICFFAFISAWKIAGSVAGPLKKMMMLMRRVEDGDLSVTMNLTQNDEIGMLGNSFNVMVQKIRTLMNKVYEEQKELRKAELKALQAQINPHFLYNTLESIIWLARAKRNDEIISIVTALTKLFRIGISRGKETITVEQEIEHVKSYLTIQHLRYKNKLTYTIEVPESMWKYKTLKLLLQPIVENAIYHGIKMKKEMGRITIIGYESEKDLIFTVQDTGPGMTDEQLQMMRNMLNHVEGERQIESYGVKNVNERIRIYFGTDYGLTYFSDYGKGTTVEIKIPKMLGVDDVAKSSFD